MQKPVCESPGSEPFVLEALRGIGNCETPGRVADGGEDSAQIERLGEAFYLPWFPDRRLLG